MQICSGQRPLVAPAYLLGLLLAQAFTSAPKKKKNRAETKSHRVRLPRQPKTLASNILALNTLASHHIDITCTLSSCWWFTVLYYAAAAGGAREGSGLGRGGSGGNVGGVFSNAAVLRRR